MKLSKNVRHSSIVNCSSTIIQLWPKQMAITRLVAQD